MPDVFSGRTPAVGLAYSSYVDRLVRERPGLIDFAEVPYELLRARPGVASIGQSVPIILHSASLSMAGDRVDDAVWDSVGDWAERTQTPWIGEHLAFVSATAIRGSDPILFDDAGEPEVSVGYAVGPCMSDDVVGSVVAAVKECQARYDMPVLLENSPVYFDVPGSTMDQIAFIREICERCSAGLLIDLAHLYITARTIDRDPVDLLMGLPLDRIVEVHVSGVELEPQAGEGDDPEAALWDDHTVRAPDIVHEMLRRVLPKSSARAVTLEYNWSANFPQDVLFEEIARVRDAVAEAE